MMSATAAAGLISGLIGLFVGIGLGLLANGRKSVVAFVGFALLGCLAGLTIGLSESPVIAAAIAAAIGLIGQLAPSLLKGGTGKAQPPLQRLRGLPRARRGRPRKPVAGAAEVQPVARNRNPAAPDPGHDIRWLVPFSALAIVGILLGITIRVNNALSFANADYPSRLASEGFTPAQIQKIMDRFVEETKYAPPPELPLTSLLSSEARSTLKEMWPKVAAIGTPGEKLDFLRDNAPPDSGVARFINAERAKGTPDETILKDLEARSGTDR
jgi:hypothetical protein